MIFKKRIQVFRLIVQAFFMAGLVVPWLPHSEPVDKWLLWVVPVVGVFFCGWVCPFGTAQEWIAWIARKLHLPRLQIPWKFQKYLQVSRYIWTALIFFIGVHYAFLNARFYFNNSLLTWTSGLIFAAFLLFGLFIDRPFCNYFCPKGAMEGILSIVRPISIKRDNNACIHCRLCDKICPMNVRVEHTDFVRHPNCINCMKCIDICPEKCLAFRLMQFKKKRENDE
ncbi:MAG: 4Fe-4S binding protein [Alphaproteobacteria bacterium]|nr:4Fe-4S binding protein [Alphaproteobacteria bacterium]